MLIELRHERADDCVSDLTFDEWRAEELPPDVVAGLEEHVRGCPDCTARKHSLDAQAAAFLAARPSWQGTDAPNGPVKPARWRAPVLFGWGAAALATAAAIAVLLRPADPGETRTKGSGAALGFFVKRGERVEPGSDREKVRPGDVLRFTVSTNKVVHVAVLGFDARGVASVYYPPDGVARALGPGRGIPLDVGVELDDASGEERIFGVFCENPPNVGEIRAELQRAGALSYRPGCSIDMLRLEKDVTP
jgi:hypothetical protein